MINFIYISVKQFIGHMDKKEKNSTSKFSVPPFASDDYIWNEYIIGKSNNNYAASFLNSLYKDISIGRFTSDWNSTIS